MFKIYFIISIFFFLFIDFKKKGFLHNFIISFIIALPYFFKDLFTINWKEFRGYGFHIFCGLGGSGKTISLVNQLYRLHLKYPKLKIYTNFYCSFADGVIKDWKDLIDITNYEEVEISEKEFISLKFLKPDKLDKEFYSKYVDGFLHYFKVINHGVVFGFDEIHMTLSSDNWKTRPDDLLYYISQQRKMHKMILASSQVFTRIDKTLREQTNFVVECYSFLLGRLVVNEYYHTEEYIANDEKKDSGNHKRKVKTYNLFIVSNKLRNCYDTEEIMKDLRVGRSTMSQLTDLLYKVTNDN